MPCQVMSGNGSETVDAKGEATLQVLLYPKSHTISALLVQLYLEHPARNPDPGCCLQFRVVLN